MVLPGFSASPSEGTRRKRANKLHSFLQFPLRFCIGDAAAMLQMSRSQLYNRIKEESIKTQKDGSRTYITQAEPERYVASCDDHSGSKSM